MLIVKNRLFVVVMASLLFFASCGDDESNNSDPSTSQNPEDIFEPFEPTIGDGNDEDGGLDDDTSFDSGTIEFFDPRTEVIDGKTVVKFENGDYIMLGDDNGNFVTTFDGVLGLAPGDPLSPDQFQIFVVSKDPSDPEGRQIAIRAIGDVSQAIVHNPNLGFAEAGGYHWKYGRPEGGTHAIFKGIIDGEIQDLYFTHEDGVLQSQPMGQDPRREFRVYMATQLLF